MDCDGTHDPKHIKKMLLKIKNSDVWTLIWTEWERSWYNVKDDDPRIGGSISTNLLKKMNIPYEVITH